MKNTALITGGTKRIVKVISTVLAQNNWNLAIHYNKSKKNALILERSLKKFNIKTSFIKADLSKEKHLKTSKYI